MVAMQDGVYLVNVLPGSKIERAGLQNGDKIIEVNKRSTVGIRIEDFYRLLETPFEAGPIRFRGRYGRESERVKAVVITVIRGGKRLNIPTPRDVFKSWIYEIEEDEFEAEVIKNNLSTFVVFWADWCSDCIKYIPVMEQIAEKYKGKVAVVTINIQNNKKISEKFKIQAIPTTIIFKEGKQVSSVVGYKSESDVEILLKGLGNF